MGIKLGINFVCSPVQWFVQIQYNYTTTLPNFHKGLYFGVPKITTFISVKEE